MRHATRSTRLPRALDRSTTIHSFLLVTIMAFCLAVLATPAQAEPTSGVFATFNDLNATYYYDNAIMQNKDPCGKANQISPEWTVPTLKGTTTCGRSVSDLHTNAVVALNTTWINMGNKSDLCGREVQIWANGKQVKIKGGPFFLWEACQACATLPRIDLSVEGYIEASGDRECMRGTVPGLQVYVMDRFVRKMDAGHRVLPEVVFVVLMGLGALFWA